MGEIAEMMLDGTMCAGCGEFLNDGEDGDGYFEYCSVCALDYVENNTKKNTAMKKLHKELKASQRSPENWLQSVCDSAADRADIAHKELYGRPMQKDTKNRLKKALTIAMVDFILSPDGSELQPTDE